jgi:hypothetical protein
MKATRYTLNLRAATFGTLSAGMEPHIRPRNVGEHNSKLLIPIRRSFRMACIQFQNILDKYMIASFRETVLLLSVLICVKYNVMSYFYTVEK